MMVHSEDQSVDISIIIVNWNTKELLIDCLISVFQTVKNVTFEVWLVDNASTDGSVETAKDRFPEIRVIENQENLGYAVANNRALKRMRGRYALLLNTDAVLTDGYDSRFCWERPEHRNKAREEAMQKMLAAMKNNRHPMTPDLYY